MPNITKCTKCGTLYEANSEEQANEQSRLCAECKAAVQIGQVKRTTRGFELIEFVDHNNQPCSLQQSSLAIYEPPGTSAVWLGINQYRMHLTAEQLKLLMLHLLSWIESGSFEPTAADASASRVLGLEKRIRDERHINEQLAKDLRETERQRDDAVGELMGLKQCLDVPEENCEE